MQCASIYCEFISPKLLIKLLLIFSVTCADYTNTNLILLIDIECLITKFPALSARRVPLTVLQLLCKSLDLARCLSYCRMPIPKDEHFKGDDVIRSPNTGFILV